MIYILLIVSAAVAVEVESPRLLSSGGRFRAGLDEQVRLPCNVTALGDSVLVWKHGDRVIFAGGLRVRRDRRFSLDGTCLIISYIQAKDSGSYTCQIETKDQKNLVWIEHSLLIETPAVIYFSQPSITSMAGESVKLYCKVKGSPPPKVVWNLETRDINGLAHTTSPCGTILYLNNLTRSYSGNYTCTASNGVGQPISSRTELRVFYGPQIQVDTEVVYSQEGCTAHLVCFVSGYPAPHLKWFQDTLLIVPSGNIISKSTGSRHELQLTALSLQGKHMRYINCTASNSVSTTTKRIQISGLPESPYLYNRLEYLGNSEYLVHWRYRAYSKILKHRLTYRQVKDNESNSVVEFGEKIVEIKAKLEYGLENECDMELYRNQSYTIHNLEFGVYYQIKVEAYNEYGWSQQSNLILEKTNTEFVARKIETTMTGELSSEAVCTNHISTDILLRLFIHSLFINYSLVLSS